MNAHELKRHISGVEDTVKITRAMQMIATSKLYRAKEKCENSYRYLKELRNILAAVETEDARAGAPLSSAPQRGQDGAFRRRGRQGAVRGLQSSHSRLRRCVYRRTRRIQSVRARTGNQGALRKERNPPEQFLYPYGAGARTPSTRFPSPTICWKCFRAASYKEVYIVYTRTPAPSAQEPTAKKLLPVLLPEKAENGTGRAAVSDAVFEPRTREALDNFLSQYVMAEIYSALADSAMAIHFKRMTSMRQSTENGEELMGELTAKYNHQRQESITGELINASAAALRGE